jgi:hypothetical protein
MVQWLRNLGHSLGGLFSLLTTLWGKVLEVKNNTLHILDNAQSLVSDVETIVDDIRHFDMNPKWNTRVIAVPKMIDHIRELYDVPARIINDVKDLVRLLKEKVQPAEVNLEDVEGLDGVPTKLLRAGEKILGWATLVIDALIAIESAIADLHDITQAIRQTLEDLQGLDALFLPQGSTKKTVDEHYRKRQRVSK